MMQPAATIQLGFNVTPTTAMSWTEIYERLSRDSEDLSAFTALEWRVRASARRDLRSYGWHIVDEVTADACAEVVLALPKARGAETFAGFVYGHYLNARRRALADLRRLAMTLPIDKAVENIPIPVDPLPDSIEEHLNAVRSCLDLLPTRERRAVELRHFEDSSTAAIASELGVTEGNARRLVFNGLARLRRYISTVRSTQRMLSDN